MNSKQLKSRVYEIKSFVFEIENVRIADIELKCTGDNEYYVSADSNNCYDRTIETAKSLSRLYSSPFRPRHLTDSFADGRKRAENKLKDKPIARPILTFKIYEPFKSEELALDAIINKINKEATFIDFITAGNIGDSKPSL